MTLTGMSRVSQVKIHCIKIKIVMGSVQIMSGQTMCKVLSATQRPLND